MQQERVTQCPHCKATFKVSDEQLAVANGRVRCGACMNIFDAMAYSLVGQNADSDAFDDETLSSSNDNPAELEDELLGTRTPSEETENDDLIQDNPDEDKSESGYTIDDEFSTSFLELDKEPKKADPYGASFSEDDEPPLDQDESWAQDILNDGPETAPASPPPTKQTEAPLRASKSDKDDWDNFADEPAAQPESKSKTEKPYEHLAISFEQTSEPGLFRKLLKGLFAVMSLVLLIILLAQVGWFHYEKLAQYPQITKLYEKGCDILECTLPELADISQVRSHNLVVRSHPTRRQALIIDVVIVNEASFEQAFPDIALYFSDINGKTIAQRRIKPSEYLSAEVLEWQKMPIKQDIHVSLEMVDPGREAVNYKMRFFPSNQDQSTDQLSTSKNKI